MEVGPGHTAPAGFCHTHSSRWPSLVWHPPRRLHWQLCTHICLTAPWWCQEFPDILLLLQTLSLKNRDLHGCFLSFKYAVGHLCFLYRSSKCLRLFNNLTMSLSEVRSHRSRPQDKKSRECDHRRNILGKTHEGSGKMGPGRGRSQERVQVTSLRE